jgi:hypothetical protein
MSYYNTRVQAQTQNYKPRLCSLIQLRQYRSLRIFSIIQTQRVVRKRRNTNLDDDDQHERSHHHQD